MKSQQFIYNIGLSAKLPLTHKDAFMAIEKAVEETNKSLQEHLKQKKLVSVENDVTTVHEKFELLNFEIQFIRDTGRFDGCTGEIHGQYEDRYHSLRVKVTFKDL